MREYLRIVLKMKILGLIAVVVFIVGGVIGWYAGGIFDQQERGLLWGLFMGFLLEIFIGALIFLKYLKKLQDLHSKNSKNSLKNQKGR